MAENGETKQTELIPGTYYEASLPAAIQAAAEEEKSHPIRGRIRQAVVRAAEPALLYQEQVNRTTAEVLKSQQETVGTLEKIASAHSKAIKANQVNAQKDAQAAADDRNYLRHQIDVLKETLAAEQDARSELQEKCERLQAQKNALEKRVTDLEAGQEALSEQGKAQGELIERIRAEIVQLRNFIAMMNGNQGG
ncbi:MAG: hypothetical protein K5891_09405 [Lachnospiraceae bacterium]|nr:hypothetical protein [Lachnospiraceae bacterium]